MRNAFIRSGLAAGVVLACVAAVAPRAAHADAKSEVLAAYEAMAKKGKFRTTGTAESGPGGAQKQSVEVVWPERFHITSDRGEIIIVLGKTFMKQGGQWQMLPMDMSRMIDQFRPSAMKEAFANTRDVKSLGDSTVNGHAVTGYEYDTTVKVAGITANSHNKLWVDKATGLPARQEGDGEAMGHKSHSVSDYEFDDAIRVEPPM